MKWDLTHVFSIYLFYCRSLKYPLHIASYALRIGVSVMELKGSEFLISHTFECKHDISVARTGNVIMHEPRSNDPNYRLEL